MSDNKKIRVTMEEGLRLKATTPFTDETITLDTTTNLGGKDDGHRPLSLMLVSIGGCMTMDALSILKKKKQTVTRFEVEIEGQQRDEHPRYYTNINLHFTVAGNVDVKALERALELSYTRYCPAVATLKEVAEINYTYEILAE